MVPPYPFYDNMRVTNYDNSHIPIPGFYSKTVPSYGLVGGGSRCVQKCVKDCDENCGSYCKLALNDREVHSNRVKDLKEINASLKIEVDRLSSDFLKSNRKSKTRRYTYSTSTNRRTPYINIQVGKGTKKSKKRHLRRKTRKGGLSIWGSTADIKPCDTSCKRECPYQCKTICNQAVSDTSSDEEKKEIDYLLSQNQILRNAITMYS